MKRLISLLCLMAGLLMIAIPSLAQEESEDLVDLLADYLYEDEPGVVIYVASADEAWYGTYGLANLNTGEPIQVDDLFRLASVSKSLVATVVLQLVDEGEIELDATLSDYLPDDMTANIENAEEATIRQMLQMTSGIFDYIDSDDFDDALIDNPAYMWTAEEVITYAYEEDAYFEPGDDYYYSNSNYVLAQLIIENVTGNSLADELNDRIFTPTGMDSCYLETPDRFAKGIVRGYQLNDNDDYEDITEINDGIGFGDGGIVCSAGDLAKFLPALANGDYLEDDTLDEMFNIVDDSNYGLGIGYDDTEYGIQISHDGASSGFQSVMTYLPDEEFVIVILTNDFDSEIIEDLVYDILDYWFDED